MKLKPSLLEPGENHFSYSSEKDKWLGQVTERLGTQGFRAEGPLKARMKVTKLEPDYVFSGELEYSVECTCDRCAEQFVLPIQHRFELAFARANKAVTAQDFQEQSDQLDIEWFVGDDIDLLPLLEEQVMLSLPYKTLCRATCKGICQQCGKNLNEGDCGCASATKASPFKVIETLKV
ncbi:MAG: DUF177 domain-containing protein [Bdellovibrionales bacterium]|nr:DUF177 domain-containing protein [Bdellovibrionales bacterium]